MLFKLLALLTDTALGFAFVSFDKEETVDKIVEQKYHKISGKFVSRSTSCFYGYNRPFARLKLKRRYLGRA